MCEGTKEYLSRRVHWKLAKVTSFYLQNHSMQFNNWLLFECCFAFVVSFVGFMEDEVTLTSCHILDFKNDYMVNPKWKIEHLPPPHDHGAQESRTPLFEGGGDDTGWPMINTISCASSSPEGHGSRSLKHDIIEAWKRRKNKRSGQRSQRYYRHPLRYYHHLHRA